MFLHILQNLTTGGNRWGTRLDELVKAFCGLQGLHRRCHSLKRLPGRKPMKKVLAIYEGG